MTDGMFGRYEDESKRQLGLDLGAKLGHKTFAIRYSGLERPEFSGVDVVRRLYVAMNDEGWKLRQGGTNWEWRKDSPQPKDPGRNGKEVALERAIVRLGNEKENSWTYQMSTSSGVQELSEGDKSNAANKRRAIDLVHRNGLRSFSFIELKVDSNNPLSALFELLSYALAYLHAKEAGWHGKGFWDVMEADTIKLVVLGPDAWYRYESQGSQDFRRDLDWIRKALADGLNALSICGPSFSIAFQSYGTTDPFDLEKAAADIVRRAKEW